jgi:4-alpha-glucanotransferase
MKQKNNQEMAASRRSAGILMHITSLPGQFGIGDIGPAAKDFADFLHRTGQTYWQLLPLNPTEKGSGHSPYSSVSAFAGNTLLISPEYLVREGFLDKNDLKTWIKPPREKVDFAHALAYKKAILEKGFLHFQSKGNKTIKNEFDRFCQSEKWLDDYALYRSIRKHFNNTAWYQWPSEFKNRGRMVLKQFSLDHAQEIEKVKWEQFIFFRQWDELKVYCNKLGIKLFGDLPFYVSHDSADVWSSREIFSVDRKGNMQYVAGVPPDYFNSNGQLWGMPVFRWEVLRKDRFAWWIERIKSNMRLFDLLRLDHFRAFAEYWAIPAGDKTARNGRWRKGPGEDLFKAMSHALGKLAFVAEDLGDIDEAVHGLRKRYQFPGMKVLQFAFGDNFPQSDYLPHLYEENFIAYTGTHDNNTTRGWYRQDTGTVERKNVQRYAGVEKINDQTIHTLLIRLAYASVAKTTIIPMQDILGLDQKARMNSPATTQNNWLWRMRPRAVASSTEAWLRNLSEIYGRG